MTCTLCPLGENVITNCVPGRGDEEARIMIVGEAPGAREDMAGEPFVGPSGRYLMSMLDDAGIEPESVRFTNAVRCKPPTVNGKQTPPEQSHIDACRAHLKREIHLVTPEVIIALGAVALKSLTKLGGIMAKRGQSFPLHKDFGYACDVWPTLHPAYVLRVPQARRGVVSDLQRVRDRHKPADPIEWSWWDGESFDHDAVAFDIETDYNRNAKRGEDKGGNNMIQCAVAYKDRGYVAYGNAAPYLAASLKKAKVFTLNGWNFDNPKCRALGIAVPHGIDVSALAYLDDENQPLGLEPLAVKYLGVRGWKDEREADPGSDAFAIYNARDARHTLDLARYFFKNLGNSRAGVPRSRIVTDIMAPARLALDECTKRGIPLNIGPIRKAVAQYNDDVVRLQTTLGELAEDYRFNPNSVKQVQTFLGIEGSTAIGVLESMGSSPKVDTLKAYRKAKKQLSTYALVYERMATNGDGRAHSEYGLWRTLTGRTNARKSKDYDESTNVQNLPRAHKNFFGGYWADYSAIEFRLAAWVADERSILARYRDNPAWDPHRYFASLLYAKPEQEVIGHERQIAKSANFSQLFCGNGQTLFDYAGKQGLHLDMWFCNQVHAAWHSAFPGFRRAYADVQRELMDFGYVETATGFRRHYGDFKLLRGEMRSAAIREAVNVKLGQGIAAHVALLGLAACHRRGLPIIGFIHDSVGFDFPDRDSAEGARSSITEALCEVPVRILKERFNVTLDVPLMIDYKT